MKKVWLSSAAYETVSKTARQHGKTPAQFVADLILSKTGGVKCPT
jgi:hypothetical protein